MLKKSLLLSLLLLCTSCHEKQKDTIVNSPTPITEFTVSDTVMVPSLGWSKLYDSTGNKVSEITLSWDSCDNAIRYDLADSSARSTVWTIRSVDTTSYNVPIPISSDTLFFRVRAVYSRVVSRWSQVIEVDTTVFTIDTTTNKLRSK
jgi:hypothetical protein